MVALELVAQVRTAVLVWAKVLAEPVLVNLAVPAGSDDRCAMQTQLVTRAISLLERTMQL